MNSVGDILSECYVKCQRDLSGRVKMIHGCMHLTACACVFTREQAGTTYVAVFVHMKGYRYICLVVCASVPIPLTACSCFYVSVCVHRRFTGEHHSNSLTLGRAALVCFTMPVILGRARLGGA